MYITKIDEVLDKIIDDFYGQVILKNIKMFDQINFVKNQLEINKLFQDFVKTIDIKEIDDESKIMEAIKKYIGYYLFMTYAYHYKGESNIFINNIIEFSKNQTGFGYKVEDFFNSESNAQIIKYYTVIKNILIILDADNNKLKIIQKRSDFLDARNFLNELGPEFVDANFRLQNLSNNHNDQAHNIIKTIILIELYMKQDKKELYKILEDKSKSDNEYIYIDIVVPNTETIDFSIIENALSQEDVERGMASEIYDILTKTADFDKVKTNDDKIIELIDSKLLIPVSEDYLLYHKEIDKYEKNISQQNINNEKKKDESKIKYIINKIETAGELFNQNEKIKSEAQKLYYQPLLDRRAIIVNDYEDLKIINKLQSHGRRATEINEYYSDFITYRQYPFINFKGTNKGGFTITPNKTVDVIRSINFEKQGSINSNRQVQFRIANSNVSTNIVGFVIPSLNYDPKCLRIRDFIDIRSISHKSGSKTEKIKNGFSGALKILKKNITQKVSSRNTSHPTTLWLFNLETDKNPSSTYEISSKLNDSEHMKIIISSLYDNVLDLLEQEVRQVMNKYPNMTLQQITKLISSINKLMTIPQESNLYTELINYAYENVKKTKDIYDKKEDEIHGIKNVITLPNITKSEESKFKKFVINKTAIKLTEEEEFISDAVCQHYITWDNIIAIRKKDPNKSNELLFNFFQQYVMKNHEEDFVCKSCSAQINMKNYVLDGSYDDEGRFVSYSMPMDVNLEDIPEYSKFKASIRHIEKDIERFATIFNISSLSGNSYVVRTRIRQITKDVIDLLMIHNTNLKNIYKSRMEKIGIYGVSKELSNLFIFELDNNIFIYSSKDKDHFKDIKRNNISVYILFLILLELSDTQMYYMIGDKICNYNTFSKFGKSLFNGLQIRKNNQNTITPILNYSTLCYIIFYTTCLITKYKIWKQEDTTSKKFDPNIQKTIIHTLVDFVNSIVEMYSKKQHHYIYDMVCTKLFNKLSTVFKDDNILEKIKNNDNKHYSTVKKQGTNKYGDVIVLPFEYTSGTYFTQSQWLTNKPSLFKMNIKGFKTNNYTKISSVTNCKQGTFHNWVYKSPQYVCTICGALIDKPDHNLDKQIVDNRETLMMTKVLKQLYKKSTVDYNKLNKVEEEKIYIDKVLHNNQQIVQKDTTNDHHTNFIKLLSEEYSKTINKDDNYSFINAFIQKLETILGKDVNLHNKHIYLRIDSYIIDHDHNGFPIEKPYVIKDDGNIMTIKQNHPFYKKDVLYYTNNKLQVDIFYDAATKLLLGFKEKNKEYQYANRKNTYIKVVPSILSRLKNLGYALPFINIENKKEYYYQIFNDMNTTLINIISDVNRERIINLKNIISKIQRFIYHIAYNFNIKPFIEDYDPDKFLDIYKNKLTNLNLKDFLKNSDIVKDEIYFEEIHNKTINVDSNAKTISSYEFSRYDKMGNLIVYYIINQLSKFLDDNDDKFTKGNISYLLLDIIINVSNDIDEEKDETNTYIKRFKYVLDMQDDRLDDETLTNGVYEEFKEDLEKTEEEIDKEEDAREEDEALDMEDEMEYDNVDYPQ